MTEQLAPQSLELTAPNGDFYPVYLGLPASTALPMGENYTFYTPPVEPHVFTAN